MNSVFLLSELRTRSLDKVSGDRIESYIRLCGTLCEWYFVLGADEEVSVSWAECRECLVSLFEGCRIRFERAGGRPEQTRLLSAMGRCARLLRMGGDDRKTMAYEQAATRFFEEWEESGFPRPMDFAEELDLLSLIYEDLRDCPDQTFSGSIGKYYVCRLREILTVLLQDVSRTPGYDKIVLLRCIALLAESRGCRLDLDRDTEIRKLCNSYMTDGILPVEAYRVLGKGPNHRGGELRPYLPFFVALQEALAACGGWHAGSLDDHLASFISRTEGICPPASDEWWSRQSLLLRQRFAECVV